MVWSTARDRTGRDGPPVGVAVVDLDAVLRAASPPSSRCGGARAPACRRGARRRRRSKRAPASSSAETNCEEALASIVTVPPRTAPEPRTVNGSAPRPPSSTCTPRARSAASIGPTGAGACADRRRRRPCRGPARPPAARSASPSRPGRSRPSASRSAGAGRDRPVAARGVDAGARGRSAPRPSAGCRASAAAGVRRWGRRRGRRARSARLVSDLLPGSVTTRVDRSLGARGRPRVGGRSAGSLTRAAYRGQEIWARASLASRRASLASRWASRRTSRGRASGAPGHAGLARRCRRRPAAGHRASRCS